jgi:hypothetical protein
VKWDYGIRVLDTVALCVAAAYEACNEERPAAAGVDEMAFSLLMLLMFWTQAAPRPPVAPPAPSKTDSKSLQKSPYFAFVYRDYIFTCEMVKPGLPLFNFVSMVDKEEQLPAKQVRLAFELRKVQARFFVVETGDPKEPVITPSLRMRSRSAFGVRLQGDFPAEKDLYSVVVEVGGEDFKLVPLTSFDFENLALKINRLNLGSPDFEDDWRVLKLEVMGTREPVRRFRRQ